MATTADVRRLLEPTSLSADLVDELLAEASAVWLMGERADVLAGDLVLCHPPLAPAEVRAVAKPTATPNAWRVSVAAHDRPGLLAALAGALASQRLSITDASATILPAHQIALQRVTAVHADGTAMEQADWQAVGDRLKSVLASGDRVIPTFQPRPPVTVEAHPQGVGRTLVTIEAPDRVGLLWAVASWFEEHGCNVEAYKATSSAGMAGDNFLVVGECDCTGLAAAIGGTPVQTWWFPLPMRMAIRIGVAGVALAAAITTRVVRALRRRA